MKHKEEKDIEKELSEYLDLKEFLKKTKRSKSFINKATKTMGLPRYKEGGRLKFKLKDYLEWLEQRRKVG